MVENKQYLLALKWELYTKDENGVIKSVKKQEVTVGQNHFIEFDCEHYHELTIPFKELSEQQKLLLRK